MGVGGQRQASAALPPEKEPVPIVQEVGRAPGPVWTGAENLARTGILYPDRPARSESLYRLSYRCPAEKIQCQMVELQYKPEYKASPPPPSRK